MEPNQNLNNMKKNILILCAVLLFAACGQKSKTEQPVQAESQTEAANDYAHLNPAQNDGTDHVQEDLSGKVIALTADEFLARVTDIDPEKGLRYKGKTPCIVDFYADWCGPCRGLAPIAEKMAKKYKGQLIIYKVNVDKAQNICGALNISNIPTLLFMKPNAQPGIMVGAPTESEFDQAIQDFIK